MALAVLYAQLTEDGIGVGDINEMLEIDTQVKKFIKKTLKYDYKVKGDKICPDMTATAQKYVKELFN